MWEIPIEWAARFPVVPGNLPSGTALVNGATGGEENHVLVIGELAKHQHQMYVDGQGTSNSDVDPTSTSPVYMKRDAGVNTDYRMSKTRSDDTSLPTVGPTAIAGNDQGHNNMPPYFVLQLIRRTNRLFYTKS
jgi:microcystin-dependent protein